MRRSLVCLAFLSLVLSSLGGSAAATPISIRPAQSGSYATIDGLSVPVAEGSKIGSGRRVGDMCVTIVPIHIRYIFDSTNRAATVVWAFNEHCEAIIQEITPVSGGPEFAGSAADVYLCRSIQDSYCLPHGTAQDMSEESTHEMFAGAKAFDWRNTEVSSVEAFAQYKVRLNDDGTKQIGGTGVDWADCDYPDSQMLVREADCTGGPFDGQVLMPDGSAEPSYGIDVRGQFAFFAPPTATAASYGQYCEVFDGPTEGSGEGDCTAPSGTFPLGWYQLWDWCVRCEEA